MKTKVTDSIFKAMSLEKKYSTLEKQGHYIASRVYRGMEVYLYKVDNFYVEVWKRYMSNAITWIEVVPEKYLMKYTHSVNLKELLKDVND